MQPHASCATLPLAKMRHTRDYLRAMLGWPAMPLRVSCRRYRTHALPCQHFHCCYAGVAGDAITLAVSAPHYVLSMAPGLRRCHLMLMFITMLDTAAPRATASLLMPPRCTLRANHRQLDYAPRQLLTID